MQWISLLIPWTSWMQATRIRMGTILLCLPEMCSLTNWFSKRLPWFDTLQSYNPAIHRIKQAMFHCAVVDDIASHPLPPPHPELLKYFETPKKVHKRSRDAAEECASTFKVKEGDQVEHLRIRVLIEYLCSAKEDCKSSKRRSRPCSRRR
jgi:hypothetical protein